MGAAVGKNSCFVSLTRKSQAGRTFRTRRKRLQDNAFEARVPNALSAFGMERAEPLRGSAARG
jgi:hypothetical protein